MKLRRGKLTVSQLLNQSDVADIIAEIGQLTEVTTIMVLWSGSDTITHVSWHGRNAQLLWNLETAKKDLMGGDDD